MKTAVILALMVFLVPPQRQTVNGEEEKDARKRYETIAEAIHEVASADVTLTQYLIVVARHESAFKRSVHVGKERGDDGQAWGLFQELVGREPTKRVRGMPYRARDLVGVNAAATRRAVTVAAARLGPAIRSCKGNAACVFRRYGGVRSKDDPRIRARVSTLRRIRGK